MLTKNQEAFVAALLEGKSQRQAYYIAYPKSKNWKAKTADNNAYKLAHKNEIAARLNEYRAKIEAEVIAKNVWNRQKAQETLLWLIDTAKAQADEYKELSSPVVSGIMGAVKELNELTGIKTEKPDQEDNGLISAINNSAKEVWSEISEVRAEANESAELVEPPGDID